MCPELITIDDQTVKLDKRSFFLLFASHDVMRGKIFHEARIFLQRCLLELSVLMSHCRTDTETYLSLNEPSLVHVPVLKLVVNVISLSIYELN